MLLAEYDKFTLKNELAEIHPCKMYMVRWSLKLPGDADRFHNHGTGRVLLIGHKTVKSLTGACQ